MSPDKKKRKNFDFIYLGITIVFWLLFLGAAFIADDHDWVAPTVSIALIAWVLYTLFFAFKHWSWFIFDMIHAYKTKNDLFSGAGAILFLFLTLILITNSPTSVGLSEQYISLANTLSSFFMAAMSAMIGLMGVQYTLAIQERNRKEDLRRATKPYFAVEAYVVDRIPDEGGHTFRRIEMGLHIHNISNNIGIPCSIRSIDASDCNVELEYTPLPHDGITKKCVEIWSKEPYSGSANIELYYKDAFDNQYKMHITFDLRKNPEISNTRILSDMLICE